MEEITSVSNYKIKETAKLAQKKYRNEKGLFLLEGEKPVKEAFEAGIEIESLFTTKKHAAKFSAFKDKVIIVTEPVLEKISTTESVPEAAAVAKQKNYVIDVVKSAKRVLLIENVKDAGNLGTLIRTACAFEIEAVLLCGDTVDIYNPKVVRSSVGAMFKLPIAKTTLADAKKAFSNSAFVASVVNHKDIVNPQTINFKNPFVLLLGSEADGLTDEALDIADIKTTIPISNKTESLNLSSAGSILLYISSM